MTHVTTDPSTPRRVDLADLAQRSVALIERLQHPQGAAQPFIAGGKPGDARVREGASDSDVMSLSSTTDATTKPRQPKPKT